MRTLKNEVQFFIDAVEAHASVMHRLGFPSNYLYGTSKVTNYETDSPEYQPLTIPELKKYYDMTGIIHAVSHVTPDKRLELRTYYGESKGDFILEEFKFKYVDEVISALKGRRYNENSFNSHQSVGYMHYIDNQFYVKTTPLSYSHDPLMREPRWASVINAFHKIFSTDYVTFRMRDMKTGKEFTVRVDSFEDIYRFITSQGGLVSIYCNAQGRVLFDCDAALGGVRVKLGDRMLEGTTLKGIFLTDIQLPIMPISGI